MTPADRTIDDPEPDDRDPVRDEEVEALLSACRLLVAIGAQSIAATESVLDVPAFRTLVLAAGDGSISVEQVAEQLRTSPAKAAKICSRLALMNLLRAPHRAAHEPFTLTPQGQGLVHMAMSRRRAAVEPVLARLPPGERNALVTALREFAGAAGEPERHELWAMGWTH